MATQTTVTLVDDLDGSNADEQLEFMVDGKSYEIDLSAKNGKKLRDALAPYVTAARRTGGRRRGGETSATAARPTTDREQNQAIREWAQQQGMNVSERGRIPASALIIRDRGEFACGGSDCRLVDLDLRWWSGWWPGCRAGRALASTGPGAVSGRGRGSGLSGWWWQGERGV